MVANIFGVSPVRPLEQHIDIACRCARELRPFFASVISGNWDEAARHRDEIARLEHEADDIKTQIRIHLPKSLFLPVPREDILELLLVQDKIANRARDVAGLVMGRRMQIPKAIAEDFLDFVERNGDAAGMARASVGELDELFATGFRGAEAELVEGLVQKLDAIETDTDTRQVALRGSLFAIEAELPPVDAVFLYRVIELLGEIADMCERVGRRLEILLAH